MTGRTKFMAIAAGLAAGVLVFGLLSARGQAAQQSPSGSSTSPGQTGALRTRTTGPNGSAATFVAPGRRVFALPILASHAVGGAVVAGDRITVIGNQNTRGSDPPSALLHDVLVLGLAGETPAPARSDQAGSGATALGQSRDAQKVLLLDVSAEEAVVLAGLIDTGHVYVALESTSGGS